MKRNIKHALYITISTAIAMMLLAVGSVFGAQNATSGYLNPDLRSETAAESDAGSVKNGTNGITARIQADLESVKSKINGAVKSLQEAVALNQASARRVCRMLERKFERLP